MKKCKSKKCSNKRKKNSKYCGKHESDNWKDKMEKSGKTVCSNWKRRSCRNTIKSKSKHKTCKDCRNEAKNLRNKKNKNTKCQGKTRELKDCIRKKLEDEDFCKNHLYMKDYTEYQLENLESCSTCRLAFYSNEFKTCDKCRKKNVDKKAKRKEKIISCKKEGCKNKKSKENEFCGKHQKDYLKSEAEKLDKRNCTKCAKIMKKSCKYANCRKCREKRQKQEKKYRSGKNVSNSDDEDNNIKKKKNNKNASSEEDVKPKKKNSKYDSSSDEDKKPKKKKGSKNNKNDSSSDEDIKPKKKKSVCADCKKKFDSFLTFHKKPSRRCEDCHQKQKDYEKTRPKRIREYKKENMNPEQLDSHHKKMNNRKIRRKENPKLATVKDQIARAKEVDKIGYDKYHEKRAIQQKNWRKQKKKEGIYKGNQYGDTMKRLLYVYTRSAKLNGVKWELICEQFEILVNDNCFYCGFYDKKMGIDKKNPMGDYTEKNSVPCCANCNYMKGCVNWDIFINKCKHISKYNGNRIKLTGLKRDYKLFTNYAGKNGYSRYKTKAKKKKKEFNLSQIEFNKIINEQCYICGKKSKKNHKNGIDRTDNTRGYIKENCRPCCGDCNYMKKDSNYLDFLFKCDLISIYHESKKYKIKDYSLNKFISETIAKRKMTSKQRKKLNREYIKKSKKKFLKKYNSKKLNEQLSIIKNEELQEIKELFGVV